ncbi:MAG TPA: adenine deaminase [Clostridia bacterium]|nr:adenine deaminase [Clostridia bacterium]
MENPKPLWEVTADLSAVAMGRLPADLVIRNGQLVNVFTGEILEHMDVAVKHGRIALVGDASGCIGKKTRIIEANHDYLVPGFLDGHIHVESSMLTVREYARITVPHGTSAIFMDPHEIVNVSGLDAMRVMMDDASWTPLRVFTTTPSCVPAAPGLENTGGAVSAEDIEDTMKWSGVAGLGEMMDIFGILDSDPKAHAKVAAVLRAGKPVTGHFALPDTGSMLNAYAAAGISSCHESTRPEEALAKLRLGMYAMVREGSAWDDLPTVIKAVTQSGIDTRRVVFVSDDLHADTILSCGHMDAIARLAIQCGVEPVTAIQMITINTAECFGLSGEIGSIAPGRLADINILSALKSVRVRQVIIGGEPVAENGELCTGLTSVRYPEFLRTTMKINRVVQADDFAVPIPGNVDYKGVRVMEIHENNVLTSSIIQTLPVENGMVQSDPEQDICKVAVINRHGLDSMFVGFVKGFSLKKGAAASTYAHDAHNLIIVGKNEEDMALAANTLVSCGGGMTAVADGEVLQCVELPVAGLISEKSASEVAGELKDLAGAWKEFGCPIESPFMTMSLLSLAVIPELRITDKGMVDVLKNKLVSLFV